MYTQYCILHLNYHKSIVRSAAAAVLILVSVRPHVLPSMQNVLLRLSPGIRDLLFHKDRRIPLHLVWMFYLIVFSSLNLTTSIFSIIFCVYTRSVPVLLQRSNVVSDVIGYENIPSLPKVSNHRRFIEPPEV